MAGKRYLQAVDFAGIATAVAAVVLAVVLSVAAIGKVRDRTGAVEGAISLGAGRLAGPISLLLPFVEMTVGILLLVPQTRRLGGALAVALLVAFSLAIARVLRSGRRPRCHCFGRHAVPLSGDALVRNAALAALALVVAVSS
jgi:Methylamine utilisation protein MauE